MKPLKITTRGTAKLRDRVKMIDFRIGAHKHLVDTPFNTAALVSKQVDLASLTTALSALIDAKTGAINAALDKVNGKAVAHTINTYAGVAIIADRAEELLDSRGVTQKSRVGTTVIYTPSGPSASSYKYAAVSTTITLKRVADGWRLIDASRSSVWPKSAETFCLVVGSRAAEDINRAAFANIVVQFSEGVAA